MPSDASALLTRGRVRHAGINHVVNLNQNNKEANRRYSQNTADDC